MLVPVAGVVDGDTVTVRLGGQKERVRVIGIDTPELRGDECYARQAASRMQSLVQSREVQLVTDPPQGDRDRYGRLLRHVRLADGRSAAKVLLEEGFAREYTYRRAYEGQAEYRAAEAAAQKSHAGLWGACPASPRRGPSTSARPTPSTTSRRPADAPKGDRPAGGSCDIKGNINRRGEKIYHVPGGRSYARTTIDTSRGERMFCSESEARAAGWRAARD
ncbi:putative nuclease [Mobilicoccus pelagius NBRC 104925]|uniref:Putative nuclease n=1 Tax=Mobilicoccus pelagius NBRC 104925 TaxID=1089455 RepID=H5UVN4_9MICO|nr:putative nuclease [Mobilicoccus pelagius NBRC 104925]